ncbi:putative ribonuclease H-like domain-containing protein [Tanacetum coccineum]
MTSPYPSPPFTVPSPSGSLFSIPTTSEPVFSVATTEPVFQSQTSHSAQPSQNTQPQFQQYNSTIISSSNAKFPYLKKEEYETWAMKMEYWIMNSDHNLWNIVLHGNSRKWTGRDPRGNIMILPPVTSLPEYHMADFHHLDDAKDIWLAVKARFGGNEESEKMRKSMLKPNNKDCNMKFLRALPPSWSQVAITLKTKGDLDFLSFDDLYNKLRTLEIDVKGGSSYDSRVPAAPTHSAFISAASTNSKWSTDGSKCQPSSVSYTTTSSSADASGNVIENVLHSFVAESDPQQQITYEDFDQIGKLDLEELDIKWQMAMLSVRINRFEKKAGRKFKFNNKDAARFDKKKVRCYQCSELGHFARECTGKKVDSKTRYSQFKIKELDKSEEPKALVSVDSMLNWSDHESEDMEKGASEVYGMIAGYGDDAVIPAVDAADGVSTDGIFADGVFVATGNGSDGVSVAAGVGADGVSVTSSDATDAETQFALMGLSPQVQSCPFGCNYIYTELKKDFDNLEVQYKECFIQVQAYKSSLQNLEQQKSWYQNNQLALEEKLRILTADLGNTTNMLKYTENLNDQLKLEQLETQDKLEESEARFDKWKESSKNLNKLINSSMSTRTKFGLGYGETFGSDEVFDPSAPSIFDSTPEDVEGIHLYDRFDKAVGIHAVPPPITGTFMPPSNRPDIDDTHVQTSSSKTNEPLASASSSVHLKTLHKTNDQGPCNITQSPSFSFKKTVKTPRNLYCDFYENQLRLNNATVWKKVENVPSFLPRPAYVPAGSRNRPTSVPADRELLLRPQQVVLGKDNPYTNKDLGIVDSGCSRSMTGNKEKLADFVKIKGGTVTFGGGDVSTISEPLQLLHMDLFGPTFIRSIDHKSYSLVVTDDFNRSKGIKRDYSVARTPQQNGVAKRKNRTLIEAARTMLADSKLPTMFWTEVVSTACYVLNRVLVTRPHNKTPYELLSGKVPNISHLKPFGCPVTILNTSDHLGKFEGKADEGFLVGYSAHSKAYRVYNLSNKKIEETLNLRYMERYMEGKPNVQGLGHEWYFDLDYLTDSLGYTHFKSNQPAGTQATNTHAGTYDDSDSECDEQVIVVPSFPSNHFSGPKVHTDSAIVESTLDYAKELARLQGQAYEANSPAKDTWKTADTVPAGSGVPTTIIPAGSVNQATSGSAVPSTLFSSVVELFHADDTPLPPGHSLGSSENSMRFLSPSDLANHISSSLEMEGIHHHPTTGIFSESTYDADFGGSVTNLATIAIDPVSIKKVHTIHLISQIIGDITSPVLTRGTLKKSKFGESALAVYVHDQQRNNHTDYLHCLFACFLSQLEPSSVAQALHDPDWVEAMQEEMQQFVNQDVWNLVSLPEGKTAIGTKWILKNKRDARGIVVQNKARLVAQGHRQEEGIDYDEVFAPVAQIEAIRLFLAFASYMGFMVYQMDVKSAFLYGEIDEEVYVTQPKGFEDPFYPKHVYRVVKALYGLHQAPRAWYARLSTFLLKHNYRRGTIDKTLFIKKNSRDIILVQVYVDDIIFGSTNKAWCTEFEVLMKGEFEMSAMGELTFFLGLQVKQKPDGIFISQDKYVQDMLKRFDMESVRPATTPYEAAKPKSKDEPDDAVNVHLYRSMIGSLMYLTASRPDIMFAVSACSRHQVTPLTSNLNAVKKIFKYLKGQPKLGLWYPRDSPFVLEAYSNSDYAGSNVVATSSTKAEYVAAAHCCGQSTICIVKTLVFHQRTKHIEIRHHFIRDANEKNLIQVLKIHTDDNVADLLTKAFNGPRGMIHDFLLTEQFLLVVLLVSTGRVVPAASTRNPIQATVESMVSLKYRDEHNKIGFLEKPKGSNDYHQVIDFLLDSHIRYAIVTDPLIYDSLIIQFWSTALLRSSEVGLPAIVVTIDGTPYTITESLVRSQLQLQDEGGIVDMPIDDIFLGMDSLGYPTERKLTFHKNKFSPQWRFLIHTLSNCLSTKSGSWDQFGSHLAIALICLCEGRKFNWSNYIFTGMVNNINNSKKFLMFPSKMFANMRLNFHGDHMPLVVAMLPPPQADIAPNTSGEAAPPNPQTDHETVTDNVPQTASPHDQASLLPRPTTTPTKFTSTNVEDDAFVGSFDISPPRSTKAPPKDSQASDLNAYKLVFKEVVGKLIKKVKELEDKLKARKKKFVVTEFDIEENEEQDVDPLIQLAKAAATAGDSVVPAGDSKKDAIPTSSSIPSDAFARGSPTPPGDTTGSTAAPSEKGKSPLLEEEHPVRKRSFKKREEDRLGEEAAKKLYEEEMAALE